MHTQTMSDAEMIDDEPETSSDESEQEEDNDASEDNLEDDDDLEDDDNPFDDETLPDGAGYFASTQTSFDHYFTLASRKLQTSSNVFSRSIPQIDRETFFKTVSNLRVPEETQAYLDALHASFRKMIPNYLLELTLGFNLMFYGFGSKRTALNEFANACAKVGHVFVANGFLQDFSLKNFLLKIDESLDISSPALETPQVDAHCRRLSTIHSKPSAKRLILVFHNIDIIGIRNPKARRCIQILNNCSKIHVVASMDNIMAPLMWSDTTPISDLNNHSDNDISSRALSWLWHDLTTLQSYDTELANVDRTSFSGAHSFRKAAKQKTGTGATAQGPVTETAAHHVLASVTEKAKRLFSLLGQTQLDTLTESEATQLQDAGMSYERLFTSARDDFIATSDTALRALLGEFRDHGMVSSANAAEGGETLWIPMPKESLARVLKTLQSS